MAALNVQSGKDVEEAHLTSAINTTPLVDIMLVMLIIFLITIPVALKVVPVELPNAKNIATVTKPENIVIAVDKDENVYFNNQLVDYGELRGRFVDALKKAAGSAGGFPEVHIRADERVRFQAVGRVVLAAQEAGVPKVGFITEPRNGSN
ncbi:MAG: biopolymer transporter ExbD [Alphaproteobacteria bacterium]|nr:biopolymer transporter ExbD [Alphaproteobacteria bacterium]